MFSFLVIFPIKLFRKKIVSQIQRLFHLLIFTILQLRHTVGHGSSLVCHIGEVIASPWCCSASGGAVALNTLNLEECLHPPSMIGNKDGMFFTRLQLKISPNKVTYSALARCFCRKFHIFLQVISHIPKANCLMLKFPNVIFSDI